MTELKKNCSVHLKIVKISLLIVVKLIIVGHVEKEHIVFQIALLIKEVLVYIHGGVWIWRITYLYQMKNSENSENSENLFEKKVNLIRVIRAVRRMGGVRVISITLKNI